MPKTTKKVLCTTAITAILNLSLQPAYAVKIEPLNSEEMSYTQKVSHHLTKKGSSKEEVSDPGLEDPQTNFTSAPQTSEEDIVSWFFSAPLKTMIGAVSLVKQGVSFALRNPGKTMTMGLVLQARTVTSTLSLSGLTPNQGFAINGASTNDDSGRSVSSAGDFNGDGLNDVIIGAPGYGAPPGSSYVIYGTNSPLSSLNLTSLTPARGFVITGAAEYDESGSSVSSAGDFNGDGLDDVIIGAPTNSGANNNAGKSYVIYGTNSTPSSISLSSLTFLQGFTINGAATKDFSGHSVSSAGDFNGDGLNDIIIGAPYANSYAGKTYVIYGTNSKPSSISLSSLTPLRGFAINGAAGDGVVTGDWSGWSVSSAGDFNGDGLSDVIIGVRGANNYAGKSYVIYGTNSTPPSLNLSSLTPLQGLTINGAAADQSGYSVSSAGDFNGDGFNDVIIGAPDATNYAGKSYVIYGTNSTPSSLNLTSLTHLQGFTIRGAAADQSGYSVSSAGDFNGDGQVDLIIGAWGANSYAGKSYVIYGMNNPPSSLNLSSLTPLQGFAITGAAARDYSGLSVSSAGDFNGDGLSDLIIGAYNANSRAGKSYVIYGTNRTFPPASSSTIATAGTSTTLPTSQMTSSPSTSSSSLSISENPTSGAGTTASTLTSQMASATPTSSPAVMTSSPNTGGQPTANEAPSQSLSTWLAGAALLIGQERF